MKVNNSMNRKNDVLINDGKPRNKKEKKQLRENTKKIGKNKFWSYNTQDDQAPNYKRCYDTSVENR